MSKLAGYKDDLLAGGGGRIDIGAQYGVGIACRIIPSVTLAADWLHMEFSNTVIGSARKDSAGKPRTFPPRYGLGRQFALDACARDSHAAIILSVLL